MPNRDHGGRVFADFPSLGLREQAEIKAVVGLDHQDTAGRHLFEQVVDQLEHFRLPVDVKRIGRRRKHQPRIVAQVGLALAPNKRIALGHLTELAEFEVADVLFDDGGRGKVLLDERGPRGSAAECFKAQGAGSGKQVDHVPAFDLMTDQVEDRLAHAIFHRPRAGIAAIEQFATAKVAADDAERRRGLRIVGLR